jgi:hypothetical protein
LVEEIVFDEAHERSMELFRDATFLEVCSQADEGGSSGAGHVGLGTFEEMKLCLIVSTTARTTAIFVHFHLLVANIEPSSHEFSDSGGVSVTFVSAGESNASPIDGFVLVRGNVWEAAEEPLPGV